VFGQVGVFVIPKHLERIGRVSQLGGDLGPTDTFREVRTGAAWHFRGHRVKAQADYSYLQDFSLNAIHRTRFQVEMFL